VRQIAPDTSWPATWRASYSYDLLEVFGETTHRGYAYAYATRRRHALELLESVAAPPARVLDVAAAQGNFSISLAERGYDVTWNDLRRELVGYVQMKHERGRLDYAPGNVFDLAFAEPFDVVLLTEIVEHVAHPDRLLAHLAGLLRPDGHIVLTTPNGAYFRNRLPRFSDCPDPSIFDGVQFGPDADGHIFLLHPDEIGALARGAGLCVRELRLYSNVLTSGSLGTERLLRLLPRAIVDRIEGASLRLPNPVRARLLTGMGALLQKAAA
jgi:2-polyprenyl-6-hydroxyphenyl methylase/3-demethylubiquinone-9 3-methyltransferase